MKTATQEALPTTKEVLESFEWMEMDLEGMARKWSTRDDRRYNARIIGHALKLAAKQDAASLTGTAEEFLEQLRQAPGFILAACSGKKGLNVYLGELIEARFGEVSYDGDEEDIEAEVRNEIEHRFQWKLKQTLEHFTENCCGVPLKFSVRDVYPTMSLEELQRVREAMLARRQNSDDAGGEEEEQAYIVPLKRE